MISASLLVAIVYGGVVILIFIIFSILTPYFYFKYEKEKDILEEENNKAKCREKPVIEMPSCSIQIIKSITMSSNQSLSIRKLNNTKRKKLDSFKILCYCGIQLQKGTPYTIYNDNHYDPITKCYNCYICDRLFHFENHHYLLFTCPQNIISLHQNGFVICIYCIWTIYLYQKNIKYYKHFINNDSINQSINVYENEPIQQMHEPVNNRNKSYDILKRPQSTLLGLVSPANNYYLFDDDDNNNNDNSDTENSDSESYSMDSYHRGNYKITENVNYDNIINEKQISNISITASTFSKKSVKSSNIYKDDEKYDNILLMNEYNDNDPYYTDNEETSKEDDDMDDMDYADEFLNEVNENRKYSLHLQQSLQKKKIKHKLKNRYKYRLIKQKIATIKNKQFTFKKWCHEYWKLKHIYFAVLLYIFDTTTDIYLTMLWARRAYNEYVLGIEPKVADNVNILGLFVYSAFLLLFYRIVSCIVIYIENVHKSYAKSRAFLQLFDLLIFWELYLSHFIGTKTENFLSISKMKAIFESVPQSVVQTFIIVRSGLLISFTDNRGDNMNNIIIYFSLLSACVSILHRFNLEDSLVFTTNANIKWPPSMGYILRSGYRTFEIISRLLVFSLMATIMGERPTFIYAFIDFFVNIRLYRKGLIGPSWSNIIGYMICVMDLASVPAVPGLLVPSPKKRKAIKSMSISKSISIPGLVRISTFNKNKKLYFYKLILRVIGILLKILSWLCMMVFGMWIPYINIFGCFNKHLDHFGFVVITSRFYQHIILLLIMYLMISGNINCGKPFCTSEELRSEIENTSVLLICVATVFTLFTFIFYLFACNYLKIGVIATERNPWLAVRVGDIRDALQIFRDKEKELNINIKSHQFKATFWKKFISSKYKIPDVNNFQSKNLRSIYTLLKTEDEANWDIPLIKDIAFDAVRIGYMDIFEVLFHKRILRENDGISPLLNPYNCINNNGNYLLHELCAHIQSIESIEILYLLITRGNAKIPVVNKLNETPLHLACRNGNLLGIKMLLNGFSITLQDTQQKYPIHYGIETNNKEIVEIIMEYVNHLFTYKYNNRQIYNNIIGSVLLCCAQNSNQMMFEYILKIKCQDIIPNINYKLSSSGLSALHYAVLTRNINIVKILLNHKHLYKNIDVNIIDNDGQTPLMIAIENNDIKIINYLLTNNKQIDVNVQTKYNGYTALHLPFLGNKMDDNATKQMILLLIKYKTIQLLPDYKNKQTPLHLAVVSNQNELCLKMIKIYFNNHKNDIDVLNQQSLPHKHTILHLSAIKNYINLCKLLLKLGANPFLKNIKNETFYESAKKYGHEGIVEVYNEMDEKDKEKFEQIEIIGEENKEKDEQKEEEKSLYSTQELRKRLAEKSNHNSNNYNNNKPLRTRSDRKLDWSTGIIDIKNDLKTLNKQCIEYYWKGIENNDYEITRVFLQHNKIDVNLFATSGRFAGQTALHIACTLGHYETLYVLIAEEAKINIQSKISLVTPLLLAVRFNHIECVEYLLKETSVGMLDVNIPALDETTPFYEACYNNNIEIIKLLILYANNLNITQKTRNKRPIDIINDDKTLIIIEQTLKDKKHKSKLFNNYNMHHFITMSYEEISAYHPYESQLCKYCNFALEQGLDEIFNFFWDNCILPNLNNPAFVFLHVFSKEGHFHLLKYLINDKINNTNINWIVLDETNKYPIQYLVEWFQFKNKLKKDSEWVLSYIIKRTFNSLMFNKIENFMWTQCISKNENFVWKPSTIHQNTVLNNNQSKYNNLIDIQKKKKIKKKHLSFLNNTIISIFGLQNCYWILKYYSNHKNNNGELFNTYIDNDEYILNLKILSNSSFMFNPKTCCDIININRYYDGIRNNERSYCFPYQFHHIQDIIVYLQSKNNNNKINIYFPQNAFNSLCTLILSDDIPLDQLQYLLDILRNLLLYPSIHPFISDLEFIHKMLSKICMEMEEHLLSNRDGSSFNNEITIFIIEATAIAAIINCYKYPTMITPNIFDIIYPQLSHRKSPIIRLMSGKLLYNISLQLRMNIYSKLFTKKFNKQFGENNEIPQEQMNNDFELELILEQELDDELVEKTPLPNYNNNDESSTEEEAIYGEAVGIDEDELKMEQEDEIKNGLSKLAKDINQSRVELMKIDSNKYSKLPQKISQSSGKIYNHLILDNDENKQKNTYDFNKSTAENIEYKLCQDICEEIIDRLNIEDDIRVRSICLQILGLLIIANTQLINYISKENIIKYIYWKKMDENCCINADIYNDIIYLLPEQEDNINVEEKQEDKPSVSYVKLQASVSGRQLNNDDIDSGLIKPVTSLTRLQGLEDKQLSRGLSIDTINTNKHMSTNSNELESEPTYYDIIPNKPEPNEHQNSYSALNDDEYYLQDEFKFDQPQKTINPYDPDFDLKEQDEGNSSDSNQDLRPVIGQHLFHNNETQGTGQTGSYNEHNNDSDSDNDAVNGLRPVIGQHLFNTAQTGSNSQHKENDHDDDDNDAVGGLRPVIGQHLFNKNTGNTNEDNDVDNDGSDDDNTIIQNQKYLKKIYSEGTNILKHDSDDEQLRKTVLNVTTRGQSSGNNSPKQAFAKMLSANTLKQINEPDNVESVSKTPGGVQDSTVFMNSKLNDEEDSKDNSDGKLRSGVGFTVLGHAKQNEKISFAFNKNNKNKSVNSEDDETMMLNRQFSAILNGIENKDKNDSDDDVLDSKTLGNINEND